MLVSSLTGLFYRFKKPILFVFFGGCGTIVVTGLTYLLTEYIGWWYFYSYLLATFATWTLLYFAHSLVTFAEHEAKQGHALRYSTFMLSYLSVFAGNAGLVLLLTSMLKVPYLLSIIFATIVMASINYIINSRYVYTR
jgi:putative flippase GtrA